MKKFFLLLVFILGLPLLINAQDSLAVDSLIFISGPLEQPPNFLEIASEGEVTTKQTESYNYSLQIFEALKDDDKESLANLVPDLDDAISLMTLAYWTNRHARKQIMNDLEGWQIDLQNRIQDSFDNVRKEAEDADFDWSSAEIIQVDNSFKPSSQFAGGEVNIYVKDEEGNKYRIRVGSLFEVEGEWRMWNQFLTN